MSSCILRAWLKGIKFNNLWLTVLLLLSFLKDSMEGPNERRLLNYLLNPDRYNPLERPIANESMALFAKFGIVLQQIIDVDEKNQILNTNIWLNLGWTDENLEWEPTKFGNITAMPIPAKHIWKPDVLMYNSADDKFDGTYHTNIVVSHDGRCQWVPPGMFKSTCPIDITWFPFDDQKCDLKFGSWTYDGRLVNLTWYDEDQKGDTTSFIRNGEWDLIGVPAKRSETKYDCCPEIYIDITFTVHIRRRTLYYGFNIIIPCVLISSMSLLLFILPPDAGEKISLGVTILLSMMVFLLMVAETMPPTSDAVPLIGIYFALVMVMTSMSILATVMVLNFHYRTPETHQMPSWVRKGICEWLAWVLRLKRPGRDLAKGRSMVQAKLQELKLKEKSSRSLLANVLDLEDDIRYDNTSNGGIAIKIEDNFNNLGTVRAELTGILREIKKITNKIREDADEDEARGDWKFSAMVIDRMCLWVFTIFTVMSAAGVLLSAPHLVA